MKPLLQSKIFRFFQVYKTIYRQASISIWVFRGVKSHSKSLKEEVTTMEGCPECGKIYGHYAWCSLRRTLRKLIAKWR